MGSPKGGDAYGDGTPIVVRGEESYLHGEGATLERGPELSTDTGEQGRRQRVQQYKVAECKKPKYT